MGRQSCRQGGCRIQDPAPGQRGKPGGAGARAKGGGASAETEVPAGRVQEPGPSARATRQAGGRAQGCRGQGQAARQGAGQGGCHGHDSAARSRSSTLGDDVVWCGVVWHAPAALAGPPLPADLPAACPAAAAAAAAARASLRDGPPWLDRPAQSRPGSTSIEPRPSCPSAAWAGLTAPCCTGTQCGRPWHAGMAGTAWDGRWDAPVPTQVHLS